MRHVVVRVLLVGALLAFFGAAFWVGGDVSAAENGSQLSRRDMLLGVLTLGVLSLAAYGFDLRDWL